MKNEIQQIAELIDGLNQQRQNLIRTGASKQRASWEVLPQDQAEPTLNQQTVAKDRLGSLSPLFRLKQANGILHIIFDEIKHLEMLASEHNEKTLKDAVSDFRRHTYNLFVVVDLEFDRCVNRMPEFVVE